MESISGTRPSFLLPVFHYSSETGRGGGREPQREREPLQMSPLGCVCSPAETQQRRRRDGLLQTPEVRTRDWVSAARRSLIPERSVLVWTLSSLLLFVFWPLFFGEEPGLGSNRTRAASKTPATTSFTPTGGIFLFFFFLRTVCSVPPTMKLVWFSGFTFVLR